MLPAVVDMCEGIQWHLYPRVHVHMLHLVLRETYTAIIAHMVGHVTSYGMSYSMDDI
jgi:hypothetical protein